LDGDANIWSAFFVSNPEPNAKMTRPPIKTVRKQRRSILIYLPKGRYSLEESAGNLLLADNLPGG
jgi:hypothetical protein